MATTRILSSAAMAVSMAVLLALAAVAAANTNSTSPTALYLYQPLCGRTCIKQTYTTCRCMDVPSSEGPYRYKFFKNDTDAARAYLFTEPGCKGDVTVVKHTTGDCRNFKYRSVKVCPPLTSTLLAQQQRNKQAVEWWQRRDE